MTCTVKTDVKFARPMIWDPGEKLQQKKGLQGMEFEGPRVDGIQWFVVLD